MIAGPFWVDEVGERLRLLLKLEVRRLLDRDLVEEPGRGRQLELAQL